MYSQLAFHLPVKEALGREAFFVAPANATAVALIEGWRAWPGGKLALSGPRGAGKTHLAHVWAAEAGARIIPATDLTEDMVPALADAPVAVEDVSAIAGCEDRERVLFHLHNLCLASGGRLLLTDERPPARWDITLPDLASRLEAATLARIEAPDDTLLAAVMFKLFSDRQLGVDEEVVTYLVPRMDRSFAHALAMVEALDARSLAEKREIRVPLAREVLADLADWPDAPHPRDSEPPEDR
ncbi:chromosomal replication initiator DnaA [Mesobaculum littorinae]|uniref:Chromosomal replication initiator DnaA n=1 Tax=Mesobaculum littorinae TaxID=2486419 RepID=A0A438ALC8_9RHOB|nr:DnaA/Hda family protein [Mesobaculum littorinae]RVV99405.1 chromosomal replication initiator DnaA [Mesobaculum littorinae]